MNEYKFQPLNGPTKYKIWENGKVVLPAGIEGVEIAWHASSKTYLDKKSGQTKKQNVYRYKGKIYNA